MDKGLLTLVALVIITIAAFSYFYWKKRSDIERKTYVYILLSSLVFGIIGLGAYLLSGNVASVFLGSQILFFFVGIFHVWYIYSNLSSEWSVRDSNNYEYDSFLPEALFTVFTGGLGTIIFMAVYWGITKDLSSAIEFSVATIPFLLWFLFVKSFDFASQIKQGEWENDFKYFFQDGISGEVIGRNVTKESGLHIIFLLSKSKEDENFSKLEKIRIAIKKDKTLRAKPDFILGELFQAIVDGRNANKDASHIHDLGGKRGKMDNWWLFYLKTFSWSNPITWFNSKRYLKPNASLEENNLRNNDEIYAIRMNDN